MAAARAAAAAARAGIAVVTCGEYRASSTTAATASRAVAFSEDGRGEGGQTVIAPRSWEERDGEHWFADLRGMQPVRARAGQARELLRGAPTRRWAGRACRPRWSGKSRPRPTPLPAIEILVETGGSARSGGCAAAGDGLPLFGDVWEGREPVQNALSPDFARPPACRGVQRQGSGANQMVLRGGPVLTPSTQVRASYVTSSRPARAGRCRASPSSGSLSGRPRARWQKRRFRRGPYIVVMGVPKGI